MAEKILIVLAISILLVLGIFLSSSMTGLFINEDSIKKSINIDMEIQQDQNYTLEIETENFNHLKSVELSGSLSGDGNVNVYLLKGENRILILDRDFVINNSENIEDEYFFNDICKDTCDLTEDFNDTNYTIIFEVSDSMLKLNKISYTVIIKTEEIAVNNTTEETVPNVSENITPNISENKTTPDLNGNTTPNATKNIIENITEENIRENKIPVGWFLSDKQNLEEVDFVQLDSVFVSAEGYEGKAILVNLDILGQDWLYSKVLHLKGKYTFEFYIRPNFEGTAEIRTDYFNDTEILSESGIRFNKTSIVACEGNSLHVTLINCDVYELENGWKRIIALIDIADTVKKGRIYISGSDGAGSYLLDKISIGGSNV